jgi:quinoprotein glucose dehydrogenase
MKRAHAKWPFNPPSSPMALPSGRRRVIVRCLAVVILAIGMAMMVGGVKLVLLGGSSYYAIAGLGLVAASLLLWRGSPSGARLYGAILVATIIWALTEVGFDPWGLLARIGLFAGLGLCLYLGLHARWRWPPFGALRRVALGALVLACVGGGTSYLLTHAYRHDANSLGGAAAWLDHSGGATNWQEYGGNAGGTHFSPLTQLTPANVAALQPAWTFSSGEFAAAGKNPIDSLGALKGLYGTSALEATPLQVGGVLYTCTERNVVLAIDAETGQELWRFDPRPNTKLLTHSSCRGVAYHEQLRGSGKCAARILHGALDARLWALDAKTGSPCLEFGDQGSLSLREGLSDPEIGYHMTSPGTVAKGVIVVGAWIPDNQSVEEPSGVVRAYDVLTGQLKWAWDAGHPDRIGAPPPGETYTPGTPNVWSLSSADENLNLVYVPTGNASPDIWAGKRRSFDDRYSSSVVALDLTTGRPRWSFQTVHHDLWDYDVPAQPVLVDIPVAAGVRRALIQATKTGDIFVLDRQTGTPIVPVVERPVPQGAAPGDHTSATQPSSALSVLGPDLTETQMWGILPLDQLWCRIRFREARYEGLFTPPGEHPTINYPGSVGAISWGGLAIDTTRNILVANNNSIAYYMQLIPRDQAPASARVRSDPTSYEWLPMEGTPYVARIHPFVSPLDVPCNRPPWGHFRAVDLSTGRTIWNHSIGTARDSGPLSHPTGLPLPIGTPAQGGPISTAGGVTFIAATTDNYLRAFNTQTGEELWRGRLPAGGQATPMTYLSPRSGRQFVVVSAGGHPALRTTRGDYLVAFALPATH